MSTNLDSKQLRLLQQIMSLTKSTQGEKLSARFELSAEESESSVKKKMKQINSSEKVSMKTPNSKLEPELHFSGSAFLNSPDPSFLPIPDFSDCYVNTLHSSLNNPETSFFEAGIETSQSKKGNKTESLLRYLQIRPKNLN